MALQQFSIVALQQLLGYGEWLDSPLHSMAIPGRLHLQLPQCNRESPTRHVKVSQPEDNIPRGFIFLCPMSDIRMENNTVLQDLDSVAYWSLDPSGIEHLSTEDASDLGYPSIELKMTARGGPATLVAA
ncbi:hypothetical protein GGX14DRAFT_387734 [Mycena pura]|uniref:Uncharacterized protein n=1 Tax=Mycena pura TaxID=153505 RepID=A0AAD7E1D1_9AGAR|nr:hypothetical protein GGX14DRAFT_387734 [Mycena pura]